MVKSWRILIAPIAQRIERCPPEAEARVRVAVGVHEPPENDLERFLSLIRFDAREKLEELPDFQLNNIFFYKKRSSRNSKNRCLYYHILADASGLQFFNFDLAKGSKVYADRGNNIMSL